MMGVDELADVEEALEEEEEGGMKLEPFNLAREREVGGFHLYVVPFRRFALSRTLPYVRRQPSLWSA